MSKKRIKCGSRSITIGKPNWLTGQLWMDINDRGSRCVFMTDAAATRKLIEALTAQLPDQERIEAENAADKRARRLG